VSATGDVRGYYAALGVWLPDWAQTNATVRCFADPDAHAHGDRNPSCSVSLEHGAWRCWACGASGGAYDAAVAQGHTPASAMELLISHGLADPRASQGSRSHQTRRPASEQIRMHEPPARPLAATDSEVKAWHDALFSEEGTRWRELLSRQRLWSPAAMRELEVGHDRWRFTIPIRGESGQLTGVLRYRPASRTHKMLAIPGTRLALIPHPAREGSRRVLLVEGPPDMLAARSRGWPAIAVPGDHAWQSRWGRLFDGRAVTVAMDSDAAGRAAARRIEEDLKAHAASVRVVDLAPDRDDGYDLTNWLLDQQQGRRRRCARFSSPKPTIKP
jgi:Toprim-like